MIDLRDGDICDGMTVMVREWNDMAREYSDYVVGNNIELGSYFTNEMKIFCGKTFTVKNLLSSGVVDLESEDDNMKGVRYYNWDPWMLEPVTLTHPVEQEFPLDFLYD